MAWIWSLDEELRESSKGSKGPQRVRIWRCVRSNTNFVDPYFIQLKTSSGRSSSSVVSVFIQISACQGLSYPSISIVANSKNRSKAGDTENAWKKVQYSMRNIFCSNNNLNNMHIWCQYRKWWEEIIYYTMQTQHKEKQDWKVNLLAHALILKL